ncbi:PQQ-binding-like beta-propeller repeat protein [Cyclobacterium sp. 1_MG-2023]|uniref:PQQ-binding-like beta-propeller repeat protein n=1 Tax=Cyclobacterium sp. 1_MG-2023 TaxID=3062681 RepID=UPI0026E48745|nr:PQQ-binding-like beta-propeller repeat protein [Cyclobacterium sp. 1_MG-2023]MDO6435936.1 PQQ-binding-like beta-propeller repeat protein [Cyclobacterium sp. 1_MG-2023]
MKKLLLYMISIIAQVSPLIAQQSEGSWILEFEKKPIWKSVDLQMKMLYYYDDERLHAYDYINKKYAWQVDLPNFKGADHKYSLSNPNIQLTQEKAFTFNEKVKKSVILNRTTGEVLFNTFEMEEFEDTQIHYSLDHKYALLVRIERIKKDKKKGIDKQVNKYLSLIKLGDSKVLWTIKLPEYEGKGKFFAKNYDFEFGPVANDEVVVFSYGLDLYAYNVTDGSLRWKKEIDAEGITHLRVPGTGIKKRGFILTYNNPEKDNLEMDLIDFENGDPLWEEPIDFGRYYSITFGPESILVKSANGFNYVDYKGNYRWNESVKTKGKIVKIYQQDGGFLIIEEMPQPTKDYKYTVNWLDKDQKFAFEESYPIPTSNIREGINLNGYLILITDRDFYTFNLQEGKIIAKNSLYKNQAFAINELNKDIIFTDYHSAYRLAENQKEPVMLIDKPSFRSKKDTIWRIEAYEDKYSLITREEMVQYDYHGNETGHINYNTSSKVLNVLANVAIIAVGVAFQDDIARMNRMVYESGLIDSDEFFSNLELMAVGGIGSAAVLGKAIYNVADMFEGNKPVNNPYAKMDKLWIYRDKLDEAGWGLRIIDTETSTELYQLNLENGKNFSYVVDEASEIIISTKDESIMFFQL